MHESRGGFKSEVKHPRYQWIVAPAFSAAAWINTLKTWIGVRQSRVFAGTVVEQIGHGIEGLLTMDPQVCALGQQRAQQDIGVLATALCQRLCGSQK
jgi:hypothetical protein